MGKTANKFIFWRYFKENQDKIAMLITFFKKYIFKLKTGDICMLLNFNILQL